MCVWVRGMCACLLYIHDGLRLNDTTRWWWWWWCTQTNSLIFYTLFASLFTPPQLSLSAFFVVLFAWFCINKNFCGWRLNVLVVQYYDSMRAISKCARERKHSPVMMSVCVWPNLVSFTNVWIYWCSSMIVAQICVNIFRLILFWVVLLLFLGRFLFL